MNSGVMLQAFSCEKTVIVSDICMAKDLEKNKFFYLFYNKKSLRECMCKAYENGADINNRMGEKAYWYVSCFHNEKVVSKISSEFL